MKILEGTQSPSTPRASIKRPGMVSDRMIVVVIYFYLNSAFSQTTNLTDILSINEPE